MINRKWNVTSYTLKNPKDVEIIKGHKISDQVSRILKKFIYPNMIWNGLKWKEFMWGRENRRKDQRVASLERWELFFYLELTSIGRLTFSL